MKEFCKGCVELVHSGLIWYSNGKLPLLGHWWKKGVFSDDIQTYKTYMEMCLDFW